jgi:hypothetical protein
VLPSSQIQTQAAGNNSYTRVYELSWQGAWVGKHFVMLEAITRRSIFDDLAPFASHMWGMHYLVE